MAPTPSEIRGREFDTVRRGLDPEAVYDYLGSVADTVEHLTSELSTVTVALAEAAAAGASMRRTVQAVSDAREEIMGVARTQADQLIAHARREADRRLLRADEDGAGIVMDARREALAIVADARRDADRLLEAAGHAAVPLTEKIEQLRAVVRRTENLMRGLASGALGDLAQAHLMLDEAPVESTPEMQIVFTDLAEDHRDDDGTVSPLPAAVDRLLTHLREIG